MSYIRDEAKLPCLVSTTTRPMRDGEVDGRDYYFISDEESRAIEAADGFAELMTFRGYRYGVTKQEFQKKLAQGLAFLIVEPKGIEHYVQPALDAGAMWLRFFISVPLELRIERFQKRYFADLENATSAEQAIVVAKNYFNRSISLMGEENTWQDLVRWDAVLDGRAPPAENLATILATAHSRGAFYSTLGTFY